MHGIELIRSDESREGLVGLKTLSSGEIYF